MSKVLVIAIGSRGDIQPFVALGKQLQAAGHFVALQTAESYRGFVESNGLEYAYMNNDFMDLAESKTGQAATEGGNKLALMRQVMPMLRSTLEDEWKAAQAVKPDVIVYHPKALGGSSLAEKLNIPAFAAMALPLYTPTRAYPVPIMSGLNLGGSFNRLSYGFMQMAYAPYAGVPNDFRTSTLGLSKRGRFASEIVRADGQPLPVLYAYSRHVLPVPDDYPPHVHVTGYWFLDHAPDWQPSEALTAFLENGAPPVYVGFGSMSGTNAQARARIVIDALTAAKQRGILASGWGGMKTADLPPDIFMIDQAPHDWLFPRMAAVVHHGGAGTTAAGLRAGKPSVIVPFIVDQPFWGKIVHQLGVAPPPIPQKKLTAEGLAQAITTAVHDPAMREKAQGLGEKIRAENGSARAVELITAAL